MPALENLQLGCAFCRILCYTFGRKLCCKKTPPPRPEFSVICLGLSGVGKSTLLAMLSGEELTTIVPTTGFAIKAVQFEDCVLIIKEIGGGEKTRPYWKHYYGAAQAVIFMVNSAGCEEELEETRDVLYKTLDHQALKGLPCLILLNGQSLPAAKSKDKITEMLELSDCCTGRDWVVIECNTNDMKRLRQDFSKFTRFLLNPLQEDAQGHCSDGAQGHCNNGADPPSPENRI